jgi:hypothetical protein
MPFFVTRPVAGDDTAVPTTGIVKWQRNFNSIFLDPRGEEAQEVLEVARQQSLRLDCISQMVAGNHAPVGKISRAIAGEIAGVIRLMMTIHQAPRRRVPANHFNNQIKAYRELQRTLTESKAHSNDETLDLDGAKLRFVFTRITNLFERALEDAGVHDQMPQNVMKRFGDLVKAGDGDLRLNVNLIGTSRIANRQSVKALPVPCGADCPAMAP